MITATACGKIILFGEHAVVYGRPAIAVPVTQVQATALVEPGEHGLTIQAADLDRTIEIDPANTIDPLAAIVNLTLAHLKYPRPNLKITMRSTIPIASGLGSGAAVSTAIVRALAQWFDTRLDAAEVNALVYEVEKLHHGTPSGIDNTVIAYQQPVYFVRGAPLQTFDVAQPFTVIIGNTGVASPTKIAVGDVRQGWESDRAWYEARFDQIGAIVQQARSAIESGAIDQLGPLMDQNQALLRELDVSSVELERLISAAQRAGASGAKLVGGGRGGNMIALVDDHNVAAVTAALKNTGAVSVIVTEIR
ncbi:MAG TPA: mevalonate kinase [Anaerolineae bacterium]|nr:mevalonate kinase [Anaerolineae bacterium]